MIGLAAAKLNPALPKKDAYTAFARKQIHLLVGDAGISYVVGVGRNFPRRVHHRARWVAAAGTKFLKLYFALLPWWSEGFFPGGGH